MTVTSSAAWWAATRAAAAVDVFEMFPYCWRDCDCGRDQAEAAFVDANPHSDDCFQTALWAGRDEDDDLAGISWHAAALAASWGLPETGCMVHCTCVARDRVAAWVEEHPHDPRCCVARPNFAYFGEHGRLEVRWYKYIGRSMELNRPVTAVEWTRILSDCLGSLQR